MGLACPRLERGIGPDVSVPWQVSREENHLELVQDRKKLSSQKREVHDLVPPSFRMSATDVLLSQNSLTTLPEVAESTAVSSSELLTAPAN